MKNYKKKKKTANTCENLKVKVSLIYYHPHSDHSVRMSG